ncbi:MAG: hypothetical protein E7190_00430 [Erysipelotrichaceae bacterium]|nr:hypothetical protein [Erysipelotrichaceae bacterium]
MKQTFELHKFDNQHSLVLLIYPSGEKEFVCCSFYDPEKPIGSQWEWGHYFDNLEDALKYGNKKQKH